jgi:hypothetical protein
VYYGYRNGKCTLVKFIQMWAFILLVKVGNRNSEDILEGCRAERFLCHPPEKM